MLASQSYRVLSCRLAAAAAALGAALAVGAEQDLPLGADLFAGLRCDPALVTGPDACTKCHGKELEQWQATPHFTTFDTLHRLPEAKAIADKLGLRSVKRNDVCTKCHYTCQQVEGRDRIVAGVSCESCHGSAQKWIESHSDYGGKEISRAQESADHRAARIQASVAAGMNNPSNLYLVARQCLSCHTSPDERLVNVGGHKAGSTDFELVAWSQGMVRHNFVRSDGKTNDVSSPARLRVLFLVGVLADLEASLRATASATEKATFGVTAAKRAARQKKRLYEIAQLVDNQHIRQALEIASSAPLKLNQGSALVEAADQIGRLAYEFAATGESLDLSGVDSLLPTEAMYIQQPRP